MITKKLQKIVIALSAACLPGIVSAIPVDPNGNPIPDLSGASGSGSGATFATVIHNVASTILAPMVGLLLTAALVVFFWGMVKYINSLGSEKDKKEGKQLMVWGVVALFVMVSVWGIVAVLTNTFGLTTTAFQVVQMPS